MSKVSVCDICNRKIGSTENHYSFKKHAWWHSIDGEWFGPVKFDMCESCFDNFTKFVTLNNKQESSV